MYDPWALGVLTKCEVWQIMGRSNKKKYKYILTGHHLKIISVACAIGPNKKIGNPTNFHFQNIYCNLVEFPMTKKKTTQNSISLGP